MAEVKQTEELERDLFLNENQIRSRRNVIELMYWIGRELSNVERRIEKEEPIGERIDELVDLLTELEWEYASSLMRRGGS